jgi:hypothetical protein
LTCIREHYDNNQTLHPRFQLLLYTIHDRLSAANSVLFFFLPTMMPSNFHIYEHYNIQNSAFLVKVYQQDSDNLGVFIYTYIYTLLFGSPPCPYVLNHMAN